MASDRELLELAAKAAGYQADLRVDGLEIERGGRRVYWNPLSDDGDALRLAVRLGMGFDVLHGSSISLVYQPARVTIRVPHGNDPFAATRRAIVSVAAEIGRKGDFSRGEPS